MAGQESGVGWEVICRGRKIGAKDGPNAHSVSGDARKSNLIVGLVFEEHGLWPIPRDERAAGSSRKADFRVGRTRWPGLRTRVQNSGHRPAQFAP